MYTVDDVVPPYKTLNVLLLRIIETTIGLLHAAQTGAQVEASAEDDRQCQKLRSDRASTVQRPVHHQQQAIVHFGKCHCCAVRNDMRTVLLASCRCCRGRPEVNPERPSPIAWRETTVSTQACSSSTDYCPTRSSSAAGGQLLV